MNHEPVPRQFLGQARQFRQRLIDQATIDGRLMRQIAADATAAYARRTTPVPLRRVQDVADRWMALSRGCSLHQRIVLSGRDLTIADTRITGSWAWGNPTWDDPDEREAGVCILACSLTMTKNRAVYHAPLIVGCSLHALGRWYQRRPHPDRSDNALLADLAVVAGQSPAIVAAATCRQQLLIPTLGGAPWHCDIKDGGSGLYVDVDTYLEPK